jgi:hypothetical protein
MDTTTIIGTTIIGYNIIDRQTKAKVGFAKTRAGATRSVDKRDNEYGGYRFYSQPVYAE